jgi:CRISPR-associated protein Cas5d
MKGVTGKMTVEQSGFVTIEAWGDYACFNQPSNRSERISSIIPSHSAAVGILRGINGHRAIDWQVHELTLLSTPAYQPIMSNELSFKSTPIDRPLDHKAQHTQRTTVFLRNYRCRIKACFTLSRDAESNDTIPKFEQMTLSRLRNGVERRHIYFGIKECKAHVALAEGDATPVSITESFGLMFYDVDYDDPAQPFYFAPLSIVNGLVKYPSWAEVKSFGVKRALRRSA